MLNPFVYSLRNKDVKGALGKFLNRAASCLWWITDLRTNLIVSFLLLKTIWYVFVCG
jgi:olfactory receptor